MLRAIDPSILDPQTGANLRRRRTTSKRVLVADTDASEATDLARWITEGGDEPIVIETENSLFSWVAELRPDLMLLDIDFGGPLAGLMLGATLQVLYGLHVTYMLPRRRISREVMMRLTGFSILFRPVRRIPLRFMVAVASKRKSDR